MPSNASASRRVLYGAICVGLIGWVLALIGLTRETTIEFNGFVLEVPDIANMVRVGVVLGVSGAVVTIEAARRFVRLRHDASD